MRQVQSQNSRRQPDLSIVIPALNEEARIGQSLDTLAKFLKTNAFFKTKIVETILVSANGEDKTHQIIRSKLSSFARPVFIESGKIAGKGRDVSLGMLRAKGKSVLYMDADLSSPLSHLEAFYEAFLDGAEVVVGTRSLTVYRGTRRRRIVSFSGNVLFRLVSGLWLEDSQCGFKMFSNRAAKLCFSKLKIMGWGFDMEILTIAKANKLSIKPIRLTGWQYASGGSFDKNIFSNSFSSLAELFLILSRRLRGEYRTAKT